MATWSDAVVGALATNLLLWGLSMISHAQKPLTKIACLPTAPHSLPAAPHPLDRIHKPANEDQDVDDGQDDVDDGTIIQGAPRRLRKAETVLSRRTDRLILVVEKSYDGVNQHAVLRTAEAFGIQHVWVIESAVQKTSKFFHKVARTALQWIDIRTFATTSLCIQALRAEGYDIWVTELGQSAQCLDTPEVVRPFPRKAALVIGREADGASEEILQAADKRLYLRINGWADSFNLATAAALVIQKILDYNPEIVGDLDESERSRLRQKWFLQLAGTEEQRKLYSKWANGELPPPKPFTDMRRPDAHRTPWIQPKIVKRTLLAEDEIERAQEQEGVDGELENADK